MMRVLAFATVVGLAAQLAVAEELKKISLDESAKISPRITSDSDVKAEGKASLKITTIWPTTVCLGEVSDLDVENARLTFEAKLKSQLTEGNAYLEMWAHVGGGQYFSRGLDDPIAGETDWKSMQTPFLFRAGQRPEKVTLNVVINGKGTIWIDDIALSKSPL